MGLPLSPAEVFPAGVPRMSARFVALSNGVRLRVVESGASTAPPVVMLHGWGGSLYMFRHALSLLPQSGFRAIAVDMRGYGLSDHPRGRGEYSLGAHLSDLDALLDALELPRAALLAQSMGGGIALRYALLNPGRVSALALVNPSSLVPIPLVQLVRLAPRRLTEALGERLVTRWLVAMVLRRLAYGDASLVTERDIDENWSLAKLPGYVRAVRGAIAEFDWRPLSASEAGALAVPSVVILGSEDRLFRGARSPAERLRGSRVISLPGGHCVHEENPTTVYGIVADFLRGTR